MQFSLLASLQTIILGYFNCGENVTDDQEIEHHPTSTPHAEALPSTANSPVPGSASEHTTTTFIDTVIMKSDQSNKENKKLDDWHDFSQISAEDEKHKLTPLSQIGFRDPASTGGGQQLTILSIEVRLYSFFFCSTRNISSSFFVSPRKQGGNELFLEILCCVTKAVLTC